MADPIDPATWTKLVHKMVSKFSFRTETDREDATGWAMVMLVNATRPDMYKEDHVSRASFQTYASRAIINGVGRWRYLEDMFWGRRRVVRTWYGRKYRVRLELFTDVTQIPNLDRGDAYVFARDDPAIEDEAVDETVADVLGRLRARDRKVLTVYYGLETREKGTLGHLARALGVTRERGRQLLIVALSRARKLVRSPVAAAVSKAVQAFARAAAAAQQNVDVLAYQKYAAPPAVRLACMERMAALYAAVDRVVAYADEPDLPPALVTFLEARKLRWCDRCKYHYWTGTYHPACRFNIERYYAAWTALVRFGLPATLEPPKEQHEHDAEEEAKRKARQKAKQRRYQLRYRARKQLERRKRGLAPAGQNDQGVPGPVPPPEEGRVGPAVPDRGD